MTIEDLVGMTLTHKSFGEVPIVGIDINYSDVSSAKVVAQLPDREAKFLASTLNQFFTDVPQEIVEDTAKTSYHIDAMTDTPKEVLLDFCKYDEFGNKLTKEDWERSKKFVTEFWWSSNRIPTPVVCDDRKVYISAKAVCQDMCINTSFYSNIYMICNGSVTKTTFNGYKWRFAKYREIDAIVKSYE